MRVSRARLCTRKSSWGLSLRWRGRRFGNRTCDLSIEQGNWDTSKLHSSLDFCQTFKQLELQPCRWASWLFCCWQLCYCGSTLRLCHFAPLALKTLHTLFDISSNSRPTWLSSAQSCLIWRFLSLSSQPLALQYIEQVDFFPLPPLKFLHLRAKPSSWLVVWRWIQISRVGLAGTTRTVERICSGQGTPFENVSNGWTGYSYGRCYTCRGSGWLADRAAAVLRSLEWCQSLTSRFPSSTPLDCSAWIIAISNSALRQALYTGVVG